MRGDIEEEDEESEESPGVEEADRVGEDEPVQIPLTTQFGASEIGVGEEGEESDGEGSADQRSKTHCFSPFVSV